MFSIIRKIPQEHVRNTKKHYFHRSESLSFRHQAQSAAFWVLCCRFLTVCGAFSRRVEGQSVRWTLNQNVPQQEVTSPNVILLESLTSCHLCGNDGLASSPQLSFLCRSIVLCWRSHDLSCVQETLTYCAPTEVPPPPYRPFWLHKHRPFITPGYFWLVILYHV